MTLPAPVWSLIALLALAACATAGPDAVKIVTEAKGNAYFKLGPPAVFKAGDRLRVVGRVCRLDRSTLLSPPTIRVEHLGGGHKVLDTAHAAAPPIYGRLDQACTTYAAHVAWTFAQGDTLRACFERGRACPAEPAAAAVVSAPPAPGAP